MTTRHLSYFVLPFPAFLLPFPSFSYFSPTFSYLFRSFSYLSPPSPTFLLPLSYVILPVLTFCPTCSFPLLLCHSFFIMFFLQFPYHCPKSSYLSPTFFLRYPAFSRLALELSIPLPTLPPLPTRPSLPTLPYPSKK